MSSQRVVLGGFNRRIGLFCLRKRGALAFFYYSSQLDLVFSITAEERLCGGLTVLVHLPNIPQWISRAEASAIQS